MTRQACLVGLLLVASASALGQDIDVSNLTAGYEVTGDDRGDQSSAAVSGAGDVNGDGLADVIVGAPGADTLGATIFDVIPRAGVSYVVYGETSTDDVSLGMLGSGGFRIEGIEASDASGGSVSGAGDVNGDGFADVVIGARFANPNGPNTGQAYVVFGSEGGGQVRLGSLASRGFQINGISFGGQGDQAGISVSGAGDFNSDGLADVIVGAPNADPDGAGNAGEAYVIFGKRDSEDIELGLLDDSGVRIAGSPAGGLLGSSVSGAGDVNGDGIDDVVIGAPVEAPSGVAYVIFGGNSARPIDLGSLGAGGFRITADPLVIGLGTQVAAAGDVNGDGLNDLALVAPEPANGVAYVVFGKPGSSDVALGNLGAGGFAIVGVGGNVPLETIAAAGDLNGDGLSDVLVGAPTTDGFAGLAFAVLGKTDADQVDLNGLATGWFRIGGGPGEGRLGAALAAAGDTDGDGLGDWLVGAPGADIDTGTSYRLNGLSPPIDSATYPTFIANGDAEEKPIGIPGDGSSASHPHSRSWIDFVDGDDFAGPASLIRSTVTYNAGNFTNSAANVHWQLATARLNWSQAQVRFRYTDEELTTPLEERLQLIFSPNGMAPFTPLVSIVDSPTNTISATVDELGYFYLGQRQLAEDVFSDGFE